MPHQIISFQLMCLFYFIFIFCINFSIIQLSNVFSMSFLLLVVSEWINYEQRISRGRSYSSDRRWLFIILTTNTIWKEQIFERRVVQKCCFACSWNIVRRSAIRSQFSQSKSRYDNKKYTYTIKMF